MIILMCVVGWVRSLPVPVDRECFDLGPAHNIANLTAREIQLYVPLRNTKNMDMDLYLQRDHRFINFFLEVNEQNASPQQVIITNERSPYLDQIIDTDITLDFMKLVISTPDSLKIYDRSTSQYRLLHSIPISASEVEISEQYVVAGVNNQVHIYWISSGELLEKFVVCEGNGTLSLAMGGSGGMFVVGTFSNMIITYRRMNHAEFAVFNTLERPVSCERKVHMLKKLLDLAVYEDGNAYFFKMIDTKWEQAAAYTLPCESLKLGQIVMLCKNQHTIYLYHLREEYWSFHHFDQPQTAAAIDIKYLVRSERGKTFYHTFQFTEPNILPEDNSTPNSTDDTSDGSGENQTENNTQTETNNSTSNQTSNGGLNETTNSTSNQTNNQTQNQTSNSTTNQTSDDNSNQANNSTSNQTSNSTSNQTQNQTSDSTSNRTSNQTSSDQASKNQTSNQTSNETSDETSNQTHNQTSNQIHNETGVENSTHTTNQTSNSTSDQTQTVQEDQADNQDEEQQKNSLLEQYQKVVFYTVVFGSPLMVVMLLLMACICRRACCPDTQEEDQLTAQHINARSTSIPTIPTTTTIQRPRNPPLKITDL